MFQELTQNNLGEIVRSNEKVLVKFIAQWCGNSRRMLPTFKKIAEKFPEIPFVRVDIEEFPEIRNAIEITHLPTFVTFYKGKVVENLKTTQNNDVLELAERLSKMSSSETSSQEAPKQVTSPPTANTAPQKATQSQGLFTDTSKGTNIQDFITAFNNDPEVKIMLDSGVSKFDAYNFFYKKMTNKKN